MPLIGSRGYDLQKGEAITLVASAARGATAGTNSDSYYVGGERRRFIFILATTATATEGTDTLNVYIDWSFDDSTWYNGGHFTEVVGTDAAAMAFYMVFDPSNPGTSVIAVTADQAAGAVAPALFGAYVRARYVIVDGGGTAASFTFSVKGYAL